MKRIFSRKRVVFLAVLAIAAITAIAAYAYFTTTGSGTGTAKVGTSTALTITQNGTVSGLLPGGAAHSIPFTIDNTLAGHQYIGVVSADVTAVYDSTDTNLIDENGTGGNLNLCPTSNFTTADASTAVGDIGESSTFTSGTTTEPTVSMINSGNQDGCKGAVVHFSLAG